MTGPFVQVGEQWVNLALVRCVGPHIKPSGKRDGWEVVFTDGGLMLASDTDAATLLTVVQAMGHGWIGQ